MIENVADKFRNVFEDLIRDKKTLVKILSVVSILLLALILRIHGANKADITIDSGETASTETAEITNEVAPGAGTIYVDLGGAVANPGVYQVGKDTRLFTVIEMAGGLAEDADTNSVNQASFVEDGEKIIIPSKNSPSTANGGGDATAKAADPTLGLININTASKEELTTLNGIGDVLADRIIEYRATNRFKKIDDIMSVKGVGSGLYGRIKDSITC